MKLNSIEELLGALVTSYYEQRNVEATLECVTDDIKWVGTENNDSANGKKELRELLEKDVEAFKDPFDVTIDEPIIRQLTDKIVTVWVTGHQVEVPGVICGFTIRGTMTCVNTENGWLIASIHVSVPNSEMEKYTLARELDEKRRREQTLMAAMPGGIAIYRMKKDGRVETEYVSESLAKMCGYTAQEFLEYLHNNSLVNMVQEDAPAVLESVKESLANNRPISAMYRIYTKQKNTILIRLDANITETEPLGEDDIAVLYAVHTLVSDETQKNIEERRLQQELIDEVPAGLGIYEVNNGVVSQSYMNDAFYEMLGAERENRAKYFGTGTINATHPDDVKLIRDAVKELIDGKQSINITYRIEKSKGKWFWLNLAGSVTERREGYLKIYAALSDYNEIKRIEQQYEEQLRLDKLAAQNSMATASYNLSKNIVTEYESADEELLDVVSRKTADDVLSAMAEIIVEPDDEQQLAYIANAASLVKAFRSGITHIEFRHRLKSSGFWTQTTFDMVSNPYTGDVEAIGILRDITDVVRSELVVEQLLKVDYQAILIIDRSTGNAAPLKEGESDSIMRDIQEYQRQEGSGERGLARFLREYAVPGTAERAIEENKPEVIAEKLETAPFYECMYTLLRDGKKRQYRIMYSYLGSDDNLLLSAVQDTTAMYEQEEKQKAELSSALADAENANRAKMDFMSRMSHDMRTPMNAIIGLSALTLDDAENPAAVRENMDKMRQASDFMLGLVNDILDMARIEDGSVVLNMEPYTYSDFLMNMKTMFLPQCEAKGIDISFVEPVHIDPTGLTDKIRINQIFFNIFSNAVKYTPTGGSIKCSVQNIRSENGRIYGEYVIADTGIGMSEEFQKHLFEPFMQEDGKVTPELQGSGLGLSITKQLVELMGGYIKIESKKGSGTKVIVGLSFELVKKEESAKTQSSAVQSDEGELAGKHILLAEDHPLNAQIARRLLERKGMSVTYAANGKEAVEKFSASEYNVVDAILMDIRMPEMSGFEATEKIRALARDDAKTVPIIAMSANAYPEDIKKGLDIGMSDYLTKPVEPEILYKVILQNLKK